MSAHPVWNLLSAVRSSCLASFFDTENPRPRNARRISCQSSAPEASESHCERNDINKNDERGGEGVKERKGGVK